MFFAWEYFCSSAVHNGSRIARQLSEMDWSIARERREASFWISDADLLVHSPAECRSCLSTRKQQCVDDGFRYLLSEKLAGIVIGTEMLSGIDAAQARFFAAPKSYYPAEHLVRE